MSEQLTVGKHLVDPKEIVEQTPAIEIWKGETGLLPTYGKIIDYKDKWVILKRTEFPILIGFNFKHVDFIFGGDPKTNRIYIHSIMYPKDEYTEEYVKESAYLSTSCPYCIDGTKFIPFNDLEGFIKHNDGSKIILEESKPMVLGKYAALVGCADATGKTSLISLDSVVINQVLTIGVSNLWDMTIPTEGGRRVAKFLTAGAGIGIPLIWSGIAHSKTMGGKWTPTNMTSKIFRHLTLLGFNILGNALDPTKAQLNEFYADLKRAKSSMMGYGPVEGLKTLFGIRGKMGGPKNGPTALLKYQQLEETRRAVTATPSTGIPGSSAKVFTRRTVGLD